MAVRGPLSTYFRRLERLRDSSKGAPSGRASPRIERAPQNTLLATTPSRLQPAQEVTRGEQIEMTAADILVHGDLLLRRPARMPAGGKIE